MLRQLLDGLARGAGLRFPAVASPAPPKGIDKPIGVKLDERETPIEPATASPLRDIGGPHAARARRDADLTRGRRLQRQDHFVKLA